MICAVIIGFMNTLSRPEPTTDERRTLIGDVGGYLGVRGFVGFAGFMGVYRVYQGTKGSFEAIEVFLGTI